MEPTEFAKIFNTTRGQILFYKDVSMGEDEEDPGIRQIMSFPFGLLAINRTYQKHDKRDQAFEQINQEEAENWAREIENLSKAFSLEDQEEENNS